VVGVGSARVTCNCHACSNCVTMVSGWDGGGGGGLKKQLSPVT
jgi:hypothetical protein